jgi:hypothetical protein
MNLDFIKIDNLFNPQNRITVIIIIIIILVILYFAYFGFINYNSDYYDHEQYIEGFWKGDEAFCEECEASSMMIFIGDKNKNKRNAHLVINNDITNQPIVINCKKTELINDNGTKKYKLTAKIDFEEECQIPEDVIMEFDVQNGILKIYNIDDMTMYGLFYKDHEISGQFKE